MYNAPTLTRTHPNANRIKSFFSVRSRPTVPMFRALSAHSINSHSHGAVLFFFIIICSFFLEGEHGIN